MEPLADAVLKAYLSAVVLLVGSFSPCLSVTRFRRLLQPINWASAIGEITLIVAGVLIALAIDNWNQSRQDRQDERLILRQLCSELRTDSADAQHNIKRYREARAGALIIKARLTQGLPDADSLDVHFG